VGKPIKKAGKEKASQKGCEGRREGYGAPGMSERHLTASCRMEWENLGEHQRDHPEEGKKKKKKTLGLKTEKRGRTWDWVAIVDRRLPTN